MSPQRSLLKRILTCLFSIAAVFSLLLFLTILTLQLRTLGYLNNETLNINFKRPFSTGGGGSHTRICLSVTAGVLQLDRGYYWLDFDNYEWEVGRNIAIFRDMRGHENAEHFVHWGFLRQPWRLVLNPKTDTLGASETDLYIPTWVPLLATALVPTVRLSIYCRRRRRMLKGDRICIACNYDLRGTPGRCPECGTVVSAHPVDVVLVNAKPST